MGNMEYDKDTHNEVLRHLDWLCEINVDTVTVSIPYLIELIKRQYPQLRVKVSAIAHVNSIARARFFEEMGADEIQVDFMSNRDFEFLKALRDTVNVKFSLLANEVCLYQCPYRTYHYNLCGHASQEWHPLEGFYVDYCLISCTVQRLHDLTQLVRARWIRPEDLAYYEALGYENFKLSGRRMSTAWLTRAVKAYAERQYEGNLMDLLNGVTPGVDVDMRAPQFEKFIKGVHKLQGEKITALSQLYPVKPYVDNKKLDGFIEFFETRNCATQCTTCNYCGKTADRVVTIDEPQLVLYCRALEDLLDDLASSRVFKEGVQAEEVGIDWEIQTKTEFDTIIKSVPDNLRSIASEIVLKAAQALAVNRGADLVERDDMVRAFLSCTPEAFRTDMLNEMRALGIDPAQYGSDEVLTGDVIAS
jgi:collagenase-like PrtC family protease